MLDTHVLLWCLSNESRLGQSARALIADPANDVLVSVASLWEIIIKVRVGKLKADIGAVEQVLVVNSFERLAITPLHLAALASLPAHHRDPFDHLLIAQAVSEDATFMSDDRIMPRYPVRLMRCSDTRQDL